MKKNYIVLFLALVLSTLTFAQNYSAIEPELQKVLNQRSEELIDIQIYFKSSINSKQFNQVTRKAYTKAEKKDFVVSELKAYSKNVQADVMSILEAEELSGNVSDIHNLWIANSISCKASRSVIYKLSSHPDVKMIGYDKEMQVISPEQMKEIKSLQNSNVRAGGPDAHVQAVEAHRVWWEKGYTGKNIVVAVLDSGTNINHLDLKDHLWTGYVDTNKDGNPDTYVNGWNFVNNSSNITDDYGHGTHCAGIVCGDGSSMVTTGIAPDALLMTLKTINRTGGGSVAQMLSGVQFAVENGADVISMSLGFKNNQITTAQKEEIRAAFDNVLAAGVVACVAAGNDGNTYGAPNNVDYPAACPAPWTNPDQTLKGGNSSVICVGAYDLGMSSRGPSTWEGTSYNDYPYNEGASMGLIRPDISAPGYFIRSTKYSQNDIYEIKSGTSQATPIVAGVIALMLEKNSTLTPAQISQIIEETAMSKPEKKNNTVGAGVVNALAAVNSITETVGNPYIQISSFNPKNITIGYQTIGVTMRNGGAGASDENTSVTVSLSNDPYVTITNPTQTLGRLGVNSTKTLFFDINVDENTPSGHTINFDIQTTSGSFIWKEKFSVKVVTMPNLSLKSVTPSVINVGSTAEICLTMLNDGTAAFTDSVKLTLRTIKSDSAYATVINNETSIKPLGIGESGTGTFTLQTSNVPHEFNFFLDTYSEFNAPVSYVYEFENDMEGWTCFKAGSCFTKAPWMHSTSAIALTNVKDSHSGEGHLMSISNQNGVAQLDSPINNYVVSPSKVKVTENSKVSFYASGNNTYGYKEHFGVAVSTSGNTSESYFTTIDEWIISEKATWTKYTADLSAYAGQEIYVAIRHFFTAQEWKDSYYGYDYDALNIDDITFENVASPIQHISTLSDTDPYYFNVSSSVINSLPKVQNFTATPISSSKIELSWNTIAEAAYYNIYEGTNVVATKVIGDKYTVTGLESEKEYCYNIIAVSSAGQSEYSDPACATTFETPVIPSAPEAPTAIATSSSTIVLKWNAVEGADIYGIYQDDVLIENAVFDTVFTVKELEAEKEYCFSITAINNGGESAKSGNACATTLEAEEPVVVAPAAPVLTANTVTETTVVLSWTKVENATSYNVYQGVNVIAAITGTTYTVEGLTSGTEYTFTVKAVNEAGASEASNEVKVTTVKVEEPDEPEQPEQPADTTVFAAPVLTAAVVNDSAILSWNAVDGAISYNIYVGDNKVLSLKETETKLFLSTPREYCFSVTAVNETSESERSNVVCVSKEIIDEPVAIDAPVLTAVVVNDSAILSWNAVDGATSYNIYVGDNKVLSLEETETKLFLSTPREYCFSVTAVNETSESERSNVECVSKEVNDEPGDEPEEPEQPADTTLLAAPTNLRAAVKQDIPGYNYKFEITMMWDAVDGAKGYDIYVNTADTTGFYMGYTNGTAYVAGTNNEGTLEFYVVAFNDSIESAPSEVCTITIVDDAIDEFEASFNIYPNPVNDKLYIETQTLTQTLTVEIYDIYGRRQVTETPSHQGDLSVDVSCLNSGVYFVKVVTSEGETVKRFIKE